MTSRNAAPCYASLMSKPQQNHLRATAERVRDACIATAKTAYFDAAASGLCGEGALEAALGAVQSMDLDRLLAELGREPPAP